MDIKESSNEIWGTVVIILIFIFERFVSFEFRKKEVERNWYFNVLIQPSIEKISKFYNGIGSQFESTSSALESCLSSVKEHENLIPKEIEKFNNAIRSFDLDVIEPIRIHYPATGMNLISIMLDLQDKISDSFSYADYLDNKDKLVQDFASFLKESKARFIKELYIPQQFEPFFKRLSIRKLISWLL